MSNRSQDSETFLIERVESWQTQNIKERLNPLQKAYEALDATPLTLVYDRQSNAYSPTGESPTTIHLLDGGSITFGKGEYLDTSFDDKGRIVKTPYVIVKTTDSKGKWYEYPPLGFTYLNVFDFGDAQFLIPQEPEVNGDIRFQLNAKEKGKEQLKTLQREVLTRLALIKPNDIDLTAGPSLTDYPWGDFLEKWGVDLNIHPQRDLLLQQFKDTGNLAGQLILQFESDGLAALEHILDLTEHKGEAGEKVKNLFFSANFWGIVLSYDPILMKSTTYLGDLQRKGMDIPTLKDLIRCLQSTGLANEVGKVTNIHPFVRRFVDRKFLERA